MNVRSPQPDNPLRGGLLSQACHPIRFCAYAQGSSALILAALTACAHLPSPTLPERDAIGRAVAGWRAAGLEAPGPSCELDRLTVRHVDAQAFEVLCEVPPSAAASCLAYERVQDGLVVRDVPVVVLRPGQELDAHGEPVVHEVMHRLVSCVLERGPWDPYDARHTDPRVWIEAGGATSAQGRAH